MPSIRADLPNQFGNPLLQKTQIQNLWRHTHTHTQCWCVRRSRERSFEWNEVEWSGVKRRSQSSRSKRPDHHESVCVRQRESRLTMRPASYFGSLAKLSEFFGWTDEKRENVERTQRRRKERKKNAKKEKRTSERREASNGSGQLDIA